MTETFHFELTSPEKTLVSTDLSEAVLPGQEGDLAAMPGRALMIMKLRPGILTTRSKEGEQQYFLRGGFADVGPEQTVVLTEYAIPLAQLTADILADEIAQAQQAFNEAPEDGRRSSAWDWLERLQALKERLALK